MTKSISIGEDAKQPHEAIQSVFHQTGPTPLPEWLESNEPPPPGSVPGSGEGVSSRRLTNSKMATMLCFNLKAAVNATDATVPGCQWNAQTKQWTHVSLGRDLRCDLCGHTIVEENDRIFYRDGECHRHSCCQLVHLVDVDKMHDSEGDFYHCMGRFANEVASTLLAHEMAFPSMRDYQHFIVQLIYQELCDHDDCHACSEANCSRLLVEDLKVERQQMTHYLKIAWKCGYLNTVDGLNDVYNSIADYFHPKQRLAILDLLDKRQTLAKQWAARMAHTMREIVDSTKSTEKARAWLRSSRHLRSASVAERLAYCKMVDTYFSMGVMDAELPAIRALHEANIGSTISPSKPVAQKRI